nr:histidine kinase [Brachybacterium fresconis]
MALGDGLRSRRRLVAEARRTIELTAESERRRTFERARAQREAVARDLHDALGHRTTVISLHADVAREALGRGDSSDAGAALDVVTESSQAILAELRRTVRLLRAPEEASAPAGTLAGVLEGLPTLVGPGMELTTSVEVDAPLPGVVEAAAVRILEEAAVNIVRHSGASRAAVDARVRDGELELSVVDDGCPGQGPPSVPAAFRTSPSAPSQASPAATGYGIIGMRERAEALGGSLIAGPENGGFAVRGVLPLVPDGLMGDGRGGDDKNDRNDR